jgi:calcium-dependent protein kinase
MWSLGVVGFIMLSGELPFYGQPAVAVKKISKGQYTMRPSKWDGVSDSAKDFIQSLLVLDPCRRLTARKALQHPWVMRSSAEKANCLQSVTGALLDFRKLSDFQRSCRRMLAWSLSNKEQAKVRDIFVNLDRSKQGTISLDELKEAMVESKQIVGEQTIAEAFKALDYSGDREIHYSDFLAAMSGTHIDLSNDLLLMSAFKRFDEDKRGRITSDNVRNILGDDNNFERVLQDCEQKNSMDFTEFAARVRGQHSDAEAAKYNEVEVAKYNAPAAATEVDKKGEISSLIAPSSSMAVCVQSHWNTLKKSVMMLWMPCLLHGRY